MIWINKTKSQMHVTSRKSQIVIFRHHVTQIQSSHLGAFSPLFIFIQTITTMWNMQCENSELERWLVTCFQKLRSHDWNIALWHRLANKQYIITHNINTIRKQEISTILTNWGHSHRFLFSYTPPRCAHQHHRQHHRHRHHRPNNSNPKRLWWVHSNFKK